MNFVLKIIVLSIFSTVESKLVFVNHGESHEKSILKSIFSLLEQKTRVCVWNTPKYEDLDFIFDHKLRGRISVTIQSKEFPFFNQCDLFLFFDIITTVICDVFTENLQFLSDYHTIVIFNSTLRSMDLNELANCASTFGFATVAAISLQSSEVFQLSSPFPPSRQFVSSSLPKILDTDYYLPRPDFQGRVINVATFDLHPFSVIKKDGDSVKYDGLEMNVFIQLSKHLNFSWRLAALDSPGKWGYPLKNGTVKGGIVQALRDGKADVAFCNFWQKTSVESIAFGPSLNKIYQTFMVRRPKQLHDRWISLLTIFETDVWLAAFSAYLAVTVVFWFGCKITFFPNNPSLTECGLLLFGTLTLSTSCRHRTVSFNNKFIAIWWFFFTLLFTTALTSSIVTRLTIPLYSPRMDSVEQLQENGYYWTEPSYIKRNYTLKSFYFNLENPQHCEFETHYKYIDPLHLETLLKIDNKVTIPVQWFDPYFVFIEAYGIHEHTDLSNFRIMRTWTGTAYTSFAYRKHFPFSEALNRMTQWYVDLGLFSYERRKLANYVANRKDLLKEKDIKEFHHPVQLTLTKVYPVFLLMSGGLVFALVVFLIEICFSNPLIKTKVLSLRPTNECR